MANEGTREFTVYLDPNYHPQETYTSIEAWLLLYDRIYLGSPSSFQVRVADRTLLERLPELVQKGWVVPTGRSRFFDQSWRVDRAREIAKSDQQRAGHFSWDNDTAFDSVMAANSRLLPDVELDAAVSHAMALKQRSPIAFSKLAGNIEQLRLKGVLPQKFYTPSERSKSLEELTCGVLYEIAGDVWARRHLHATALIAPESQEQMYSLLDRVSDSTWSPLAKYAIKVNYLPGGGLTKYDLQLGKELAERIASHYPITDILEDYRNSNLQHEFRAFVLTALETLRERITPTDDREYLWQEFQHEIHKIERHKEIAEIASTILGAVAADETGDALLAKTTRIPRRLFLRACLVTGGIAGNALLPQPIQAALNIADTPDRWVMQIHSAKS